MSRSINKAIVLGNLTRDPEMRYTPQGNPVTSFTVATNRQWTTEDGTTKEEAEFHNIVSWNKLAELCAQLLKKGTKVYIEGRLQTRNWEDQQGVKHFKTEIVADDMIVLSPRGEGSYSAPVVEKGREEEPKKKGRTSSKKEEKGESPESSVKEDIEGEEIPF